MFRAEPIKGASASKMDQEHLPQSAGYCKTKAARPFVLALYANGLGNWQRMIVPDNCVGTYSSISFPAVEFSVDLSPIPSFPIL
jgi:hypothetical protein